jgi:glycosyltransferase involved in cell wall biosynthesis
VSTGRQFVMLVSARADGLLREEVSDRERPCPEYLRLEKDYGVRLIDWSQLKTAARRRSPKLSLVHTWAATRALPDSRAVLSDGEHLGLPLAIAMRTFRHQTPHVVIAHHLTTPAKKLLFRALRPEAAISRILVHSERQQQLAEEELRVPRSRLKLVRYGVDLEFWAPRQAAEEELVVSVGREQRDFTTLAEAGRELHASVFVSGASAHSPKAGRSRPAAWPANFVSDVVDYRALRSLYARASVAVVPLLAADFQAGVTAVLEAMAMGKAVVVTATEGLRHVVEHGVTAVTVPPEDPAALRDALTALLEHPRERARLGANARSAVEQHFGLDGYVAALATHLHEVTGESPHLAPNAAAKAS